MFNCSPGSDHSLCVADLKPKLGSQTALKENDSLDCQLLQKIPPCFKLSGRRSAKVSLLRLICLICPPSIQGCCTLFEIFHSSLKILFTLEQLSISFQFFSVSFQICDCFVQVKC